MMNCGGAETMIMNIFRNIDKEKFEFSFLVHSTSYGYYDDEIKSLGGKIYYTESQGKQGLFKYISTVRNFLKENNDFDIIHSHMDWQGGAIAYASHLAGMKRIIVHSHTYSSCRKGFLFDNVIKLQKYWIDKYATDYWACSKEAADYLFNKDKQYEVIPNAIDLMKYMNPDIEVVESIKKQVNSSKESILIGHIGSFRTNKNQKFLIEIAKLLKERNVDFRLLLVGDNNNEYALEVKKMVNDYNLNENVFFLGLMNDIHNVVNAFDVFCFPSFYEGLGIVTIEAQAGGVDCIVSEGVPKAVDMGVGLLSRLRIDSPYTWMDCIIKPNKRLKDKSKIFNAISSKGFDITLEVKKIEVMYMKNVLNDKEAILCRLKQ